MKIKPIIIVSGDPKSVFVEIFLKSLKSKRYKSPLIIIDNKVRISSSKVDNPKQARYAWKNVFDGTLFNKEGLPASSFITNK